MARKKNSSAEVTGPRIRAAAQRLFARHGYAAVSMRQIAAEVGVQAGALYMYTPDKQSLLYDMMHDHMADLLQSHAALPDCPDPLAALEQFTRFHIRFHSARSDAVFIAYMELRNLEGENFTRIEAMRRNYEARLQDVLQRGHGAGVFRLPDIKLATYAVIAMLTGVNTWYREGGRLSLSRVEDIYWDMVRKSVGA
ncbi:TetR/AcrR family transcriptional regulator [Roseinatronobacter sp. NSM]|uniref:TetR/AcrR family transcriptional regulator n=1 Tax=Roseinatronobacter sp. NSM TaxID=3457785 RepID=UPI0040362E43